MKKLALLSMLLALPALAVTESELIERFQTENGTVCPKGYHVGLDVYEAPTVKTYTIDTKDFSLIKDEYIKDCESNEYAQGNVCIAYMCTKVISKDSQ